MTKIVLRQKNPLTDFKASGYRLHLNKECLKKKDHQVKNKFYNIVKLAILDRILPMIPCVSPKFESLIWYKRTLAELF